MDEKALKLQQIIKEQDQVIENLKELLDSHPLPLQTAPGVVNDLYILSQGKAWIIRFKEAWINKYFDGYCIEINDLYMGCYSTKEKAQAVLLAIWDCLTDGDDFYKMPSDEEVEA